MGAGTFQDYVGFLAKMSERSGLDLKPDDGGLVSLRVDDDYTLNLQYVEATSKILCFVDVATLPKTCDKAVYRELLVGTLFGRDTAGGYFALEGESETVVYNYLFDFDPATSDPEEALSVLERILSLVDVWAGRIAALAGEDGGDSSGSDRPGGRQEISFLRI